jgi:hypothetical protein
VLRVLRPNDTAPETTADPERGKGDDIVVDVAAPHGLDGFDSERHSVQPAATAPPPRRSPWLIGVLVALVVAEAVPTALWARDFFRGGANAAAPPPPQAAASVPTLPAALGAVAPCEAPAPANTAADAAKPAGATALAAAGAAPSAGSPQAIAAGVLSVVAPLSLNVYNRGRLIGTSEAESIMLPLGSYELEFANDAVGYRARRTVTLQAGRKMMLQIDPPAGTLHINALPWAEVWMDDRRLGETPIGNMQVPVGPRELVFKHPEFGERRARVLVTLKEPARISIDMRKK